MLLDKCCEVKSFAGSEASFPLSSLVDAFTISARIFCFRVK